MTATWGSVSDGVARVTTPLNTQQRAYSIVKTKRITPMEQNLPNDNGDVSSNGLEFIKGPLLVV